MIVKKLGLKYLPSYKGYIYMSSQKLLFASVFVGIVLLTILIIYLITKYQPHTSPDIKPIIPPIIPPIVPPKIPIVPALTSFYIKNKDPKKEGDCITIKDKNASANFGKCIPGNDLWTAFVDGHLKHIKTGLCLETTLDKNGIPTKIIGNTCDLKSSLQQFHIDGNGRIRSRANDKMCVDPWVSWTDCTKSSNEGWYFQPSRMPISVNITNPGNDIGSMCIGTNDGKNVNWFPCNTPDTQFQTATDGVYNIYKHVTTGKCLDGDGNNVYMRECTLNNGYQQWLLNQKGELNSKAISTVCIEYDKLPIIWDTCGNKDTQGWSITQFD